MSKDDPRSSVIRPRAGLIAIVGFCIGLPVLSAWAKGSIAIPHNDDWAYFRIVFHLADTGTLQLVGWNEAMFLGQLVWAIPLAKVFGDTFFAINTVSALISAGGLVLTYLLASRFLRTSYALLTAFLVGIFPGFIPLATTFMTDTTGYTAQLGCLVLGVWALDRRSDQRLLPLIACLVVGLYAFTVRDFAITTPVAVLAGLAVAEKRHRRVPALSIAGLAAVSAAGVALYLWRDRKSVV